MRTEVPPSPTRNRQRVGVRSADVGEGGRKFAIADCLGRARLRRSGRTAARRSRTVGAGGLFRLGSFQQTRCEDRGEVAPAGHGRSGSESPRSFSNEFERAGTSQPPTGKAPSENWKGPRHLSPVAFGELRERRERSPAQPGVFAGFPPAVPVARLLLSRWRVLRVSRARFAIPEGSIQPCPSC